jgi:photosystem II stability/assembly factor-like uncharacterized protein
MGDEKPKDVARLSVTANLGKTWRDVELPLPTKYRGFLCVPLKAKFIDQKHVFLAVRVLPEPIGKYSWEGDLVFYTSTDGGSSWIVQPGIVTPGGLGIHDVKVLSPECFLVQTETNILATYDGAHTWKSITHNISFGEHPDRDILQMDFIDAAHGWLIIYDRDYKDERHLYRTSNAGKSWIKL